MPALYTTIGPWTLQTFTLALALGVLVSAAAGLGRIRTYDTPMQAGNWVDAMLGALVGGVIGARGLHVLLNMDYFTDHLDEAANLTAGGLDWHGAVMGGLIGLALVGGWQARRKLLAVRPYLSALLDTMTPALALIGLFAWYGCLAAGCGYGKEVDTLANYPPLLAAEQVDVFGIVAPRYNTPLFGMLLSALVLVITALMLWRGWLTGRRFWFALVLLSAGMFVIGFLRADHTLMLGGLRADQWLDGLMVGVGLIGMLFLARVPSPNPSPLRGEGNNTGV